MSGIESFFSFFSNGFFPGSMAASQFFAGLVLAAAVMIFGKIFCGYLCPVGTVQELISKLRNLLHVKSVSIYEGSFYDKIFRIVKYLLLFWVFFMSAKGGEMISRRLDPYYTVASGFRGDVATGLSVVSVLIVVLGALVVDNFWCRYVCPLGAISNTLKFWPWILSLSAIWYILNLLGLHIPYTVHFAILFILGYFLEILHGRPRLQLLHMVRNSRSCNMCEACTSACPYRIDIRSFQDKIYSVDCTLCGECAAVCKKNALNIGFSKKEKSFFWKLLPAVLAVCLSILVIKLGERHEVPVLNQSWGIEDYDADSVRVRVVDPTTLKTFTIDGMRSINSVESSNEFKSKLEQIPGVHGVKAYIANQRVVITYDPAVTDTALILKAVFIPAKIKLKNPDPETVDSLCIYTLRAERMYDPDDLKRLSWTFGAADKNVYALESEFASPLILRAYMDYGEKVDSDWFRNLVEWNSSYVFDFIEKNVSSISTADFLHKMFQTFYQEYDVTGEESDVKGKRVDFYAKKKQYIYEIADENMEKPSIMAAVPILGSHLSKEEGVISLSLELNAGLVPAIKIRYSYPMTSSRLKSLIAMDSWTVSGGDEYGNNQAKALFTKKGTIYPYKKK